MKAAHCTALCTFTAIMIDAEQQVLLQVCESCVEHCGPAFHEQLAVGPFFKRIRQAVTEPDNPRVCSSDEHHYMNHCSWLPTTIPRFKYAKQRNVWKGP